jgi:TatD DNase family protein
MLVDTHCHIHEPSYPLDQKETLRRAREAGVEKLICVGTSEQSSREAVAFAAVHDNVFASIGVHPHDAKDGWGEIEAFLSSSPLHHPSSQGRSTGTGTAARGARLALEGDIPSSKDDERALQQRNSKLVAIGEIGLDYFYTHSPREMQIRALEEQIELALKHDLPVIFHVREAFGDFWSILDNFHGIRGELHSFTDDQKNLEEGLRRGLYIGVNGISTFTKDPAQQEMFANIPLKHMLFETDAPFLTPVPLRGRVNEPAFVRLVAEHHARLRGISLEEIAATTTANAHALFTL